MLTGNLEEIAMMHPELTMQMADEHVRDLRTRAQRRTRKNREYANHVSLIGRFVVMVRVDRPSATPAPAATAPTSTAPATTARHGQPMGCVA